MSLLNRRQILGLSLALPLALSACGFQAAYGPGGTGTALKNRLEVTAPEDRNTYLMVRELERQFGRSASPAYALSLTVKTREEGLVIDREGNINRYNLVGAADYTLRDLNTGNIVTSGTEDNFTAYSTTGSTVATLAAERDAQMRLMTILANQIATRLLATPL